MQDHHYSLFRQVILDRLAGDLDLSFRMPVIDFSENHIAAALRLSVSPIFDLLPDREPDLGRPVLVTIAAGGRQQRSYDPAFLMRAIERVLHGQSLETSIHDVVGFRLVGSQIGPGAIAHNPQAIPHFSMSYYATLYPKPPSSRSVMQPAGDAPFAQTDGPLLQIGRAGP